MSILSDNEAVSPIVATMVLILVAVIGAITVAYLVGAVSENTVRAVFAPSPTPTPGPPILIVDSPQTSALDQQLARQYMDTHVGAVVMVQSTQDEYTNALSMSENISDIVALSRAPSSSLLYKDPKIRTQFITGQAVVMIANSNMNISALSQPDLSMVYSKTPQSIPYNLTGLTMAVRNDDGQGSERVFAGWLTDNVATGLENYTATPAGVQEYIAHNESEVMARVSNTSGAIGFVYWESFAANSATISNVTVVPIVNKNNQMVQVPSDSGIRSEMESMSNAYYDEGLISGLYYMTEGEPGTLVKSYIDWCQDQYNR